MQFFAMRAIERGEDFDFNRSAGVSEGLGLIGLRVRRDTSQAGSHQDGGKFHIDSGFQWEAAPPRPVVEVARDPPSSIVARVASPAPLMRERRTGSGAGGQGSGAGGQGSGAGARDRGPGARDRGPGVGIGGQGPGIGGRGSGAGGRVAGPRPTSRYSMPTPCPTAVPVHGKTTESLGSHTVMMRGSAGPGIRCAGIRMARAALTAPQAHEKHAEQNQSQPGDLLLR